MTANEVEAALTASPANVGPSLLALAEDQWFERKSAKIAPKDLAVPLVAMANADGGVVVVGLHDGTVQGIKATGPKLSALMQASIDYTTPPVRAHSRQVRCVNAEGQSDTLLVFTVEPGENVHEMTNGDCYLRIGDESRRLTYAQRQELLFDRGHNSFDGQVTDPDLSLGDLDLALVKNYRKRIKATKTDREVLLNRSLIKATGQLTNACVLLFTEQPQQFFPQAYIRVLRFLSNERGTGANLGLDDESDYRIEGSIPWAIQQASKQVERLVPKRRALTAAGTFEQTPIVPRDAWLEGIVNAVVHRSYSLSGDHIRVEIYPNRIEIESPGRFPGLANPSKPLEISRWARNPRIARVCAELRIGPELGEGIKRIFEEMRRVGLTDPAYVQTSGSVKLTLLALPSLPPRVAARLPTRSQEVLNVMRASENPLGTGEMAEAMEMSRPAVLTRLRALETEGFVRWSGKSTKDPRAVWQLLA